MAKHEARHQAWSRRWSEHSPSCPAVMELARVAEQVAADGSELQAHRIVIAAQSSRLAAAMRGAAPVRVARRVLCCSCSPTCSVRLTSLDLLGCVWRHPNASGCGRHASGHFRQIFKNSLAKKQLGKVFEELRNSRHHQQVPRNCLLQCICMELNATHGAHLCIGCCPGIFI